MNYKKKKLDVALIEKKIRKSVKDVSVVTRVEQGQMVLKYARAID